MDKALDELKDLIDRAAIRIATSYVFIDETGDEIGDVTCDTDGRCYAYSSLPKHCDIEPLLVVRVKAIRAAREARYARIEAALRWYADKANWMMRSEPIVNPEEGEAIYRWSGPPPAKDFGKIAREALETVVGD
jgi:hypothetical protein